MDIVTLVEEYTTSIGSDNRIAQTVILNSLLSAILEAVSSSGGGGTGATTPFLIEKELIMATSPGTIEAGALQVSFALIDGTASIDGTAIDLDAPPINYLPIPGGEYGAFNYTVSSGGKLLIAVSRAG